MEGDAGPDIRVDRAAIALYVEDREPVGEDTSFAPDVGQLACFSKIVGAEGDITIYHVWRHGPTERAKVALSVRSSAWRTWSTKRILSGWTGDWTCEVQDEDGNVLETVSFTIRESSGDVASSGTGR